MVSYQSAIPRRSKSDSDEHNVRMTTGIVTYRDPVEKGAQSLAVQYNAMSMDRLKVITKNLKEKIIPRYVKGALKAVDKASKAGKQHVDYYGERVFYFLWRNIPNDFPSVFQFLIKELEGLGFSVRDHYSPVKYITISWGSERK